MEEKHDFDELKVYIMSSIAELKVKLDKLEEKLNLWRQQSLAETVELKTKINVSASIIALIVSFGVTVITVLFTK